MEMKRVGFVCTGEELVIGACQDTNSTIFAQQFTEHHIQAGQRVTVGDETHEIESAINFLLSTHHALITIGGLGPTSDDRTRYALSKAIHQELEFNDEAWQWIVERFTKKNLEIPETNRQQALLPIGSTPIYNANGSAAACYVHHEGKDIFMLPGPPNECLPIFQEVVLPMLLQKNYAHHIYRHSWMLYGVSESSIAAQLESLELEPQCTLGYRVHKPYLEIKLWSDNQEALNKMIQKFDPLLKPHVKKT